MWLLRAPDARPISSCDSAREFRWFFPKSANRCAATDLALRHAWGTSDYRPTEACDQKSYSPNPTPGCGCDPSFGNSS